MAAAGNLLEAALETPSTPIDSDVRDAARALIAPAHAGSGVYYKNAIKWHHSQNRRSSHPQSGLEEFLETSWGCPARAIPTCCRSLVFLPPTRRLDCNNLVVAQPRVLWMLTTTIDRCPLYPGLPASSIILP